MTNKERQNLGDDISGYAGALVAIDTFFPSEGAIREGVSLYFAMRDRFGSLFTHAIARRKANEIVERAAKGLCVLCPGPGRPRKVWRGRHACLRCHRSRKRIEEIVEEIRALHALIVDSFI